MGQQSRNPFDDVMFSYVCVCARARVLMVSSRPLISFFPLRFFFFFFFFCECNGEINACYQSLYVCEVVVLKKNNNKAKKKPGPAREWLAKAGQGRTGLFNAEVVLVVVEGEYHRQRYGSPPLFFSFL